MTNVSSRVPFRILEREARMWSVDGAVPAFSQMLDEVDEDAQNAAIEACSGELMSHNTYKNIVHNKGNIDYCIEQYAYISNRIKCIKVMTGNGPFLA